MRKIPNINTHIFRQPKLPWSEAAAAVATKLVHVFTVGASQSGGYNSDPSLTSVGVSGVSTLTDGPLSPSTSGDLIPLVEGDTYDQDQAPVTFTDVESQASGLGQQLSSLLSGESDTYQVCVTVHYMGGTSLQRLNSGGDEAANGYTQLTATIARVKAIADANGWEYVPQFVIWTSGSGANPMEDAVKDWIDNVRSYTTPTYYAGVVDTLVMQSRITGSPDFGLGVYAGVESRTRAEISQSVRETVIPSEVQGDNIHLTNHGERHVGVVNAYSIRDNIINGGWAPFKIDTGTITVNNVTKVITIATTGSDGALQGAGDFGMVVYNVTQSNTIGGTWAVSGTNLLFTMTSNLPFGTDTIEFRAQTGSGSITDSRSNSGVIFNAANASPYPIENSIIRNNYSKELTFTPALETTYKINLTKTTTGETGWLEFISTYGTEDTHVIDGSILLREPSSGWSNGTNGSTTGANFTPAIPNAVMAQYWAANSGSDKYVQIEGLDTDKRYTIYVLSNRISAGTDPRNHVYTFDGETTDVSTTINAADNLTELATTTLMQPDSSGFIRITDAPGTGESFWRMNAIIIDVWA